MKRKVRPVVKFIIRVLLNITVLVVAYFAITTVGKYFFERAYEIAMKPPPEERSRKEVVLTVKDGSSTREIAELLSKNELIDNVDLFLLSTSLKGLDGKLKSGTYHFNSRMDEDEMLILMQKGAIDENTIKITIPEGFTATQIAELLESNGLCTKTEFLDALNKQSYDYDFVVDLPQRKMQLEGYLFPDTYYFKPEAAPEEMVSKMLYRFEEVYDKELRNDIEKQKLNLDDVIVMASIVEAEIKVPEERELAAAVIFNRLDEGMRLEMCSTVLYALGKKRERLSLSDLEVDSPYNTYKNTGLPEGPICSPGLSAIKAVLSPDTNDYLFFVLKDTNSGEHEFTNNYESFLQAKTKYKQMF